MSKYLCRTLVLAASIGVFLTLGTKKDAMAGMHINFNIDLPALFEVQGPPPLAIIPGTYVYLAPDAGVSILFYQGFWYRPHDGRWYRCRSYNGRYLALAPRYVPRALIELPPDYRDIPPGYQRIPYGQVKRNWRRWEHEKHWNRDRAWREGRIRERRSNDARYERASDWHRGSGHDDYGHGRGWKREARDNDNW